MKHRWRVPSIMELSVLYDQYNIVDPTSVWSDSKHPTKEQYWTIYWCRSDKRPSYRYATSDSALSCMFVRSHEDFLYWTGTYTYHSHRWVANLCQEFSQTSDSIIVEYSTQRPEVYHEE